MTPASAAPPSSDPAGGGGGRLRWGSGDPAAGVRQSHARRQTPHLFGLCCTAPYSWDGRNATLQDQVRGAIVSPLEMNAARQPTSRELDALAEFLLTLTPPKADPGVDFDPDKAARGEQLFRQMRPLTDPGGEFGPHAKASCATCHEGPRFTDNKPHRIWPTPFGDPADRGEVNRDGHSLGFDTPALTAVRFTAPYFHQGGAGVDSRSHRAPAAREALRAVVLPYYNARFEFRFTDAELDDLTEFLLSLLPPLLAARYLSESASAQADGGYWPKQGESPSQAAASERRPMDVGQPVMQETERVLRAAVAAMTTGDVETLQTYLADDVAVHVPGTSRLSGEYKGKGELLEGFLGTLMSLTDGQAVLEPHDIVGSDDHAIGIYHWRAVRNGISFEWRQVNVYHVDGGRITEIWQHPFDFEQWNEFWS